MHHRHSWSLVGGIILILFGVYLLAAQFVPGLAIWLGIELVWPLIIVGVGVLLLVIGLVTGVPAMAIPAAIVGGIGGLLFWQNATGNWESWSYAWALIPGFVGLGIILAGLLGGGGDLGRSFREGGRLVVISAVLFLVFATFFGALGPIEAYWPVILIVLGLWFLARQLLRFR